MTRYEQENLDNAYETYDKYYEDYLFWVRALRVVSRNNPKRKVVKVIEEKLDDAMFAFRMVNKDIDHYEKIRKKENENE